MASYSTMTMGQLLILRKEQSEAVLVQELAGCDEMKGGEGRGGDRESTPSQSVTTGQCHAAHFNLMSLAKFARGA